MENPFQNQHAHFIGIAGIAMSAVALLLKEQGCTVSGSDINVYPPASTILAANGVSIKEPYAAANVPPETDFFVVSKSARVVPGNPEYDLALASGKPIKSYAELVGELTRVRQNLMVCGSFGKSSTTALLAWALQSNGTDCGYLIGAQANNFPTQSHLGSAGQFVLEGDEYPASYADNGPKFAHYHPFATILTSAQHDHVNIYPTHADFLVPFQNLIASHTPQGLLVACADDEYALQLSKSAPCRVVTYGLTHTADYTATHIAYSDVTTFTLLKNGEKICNVASRQIGEHYVQNMLGVAALVLELGLLTPAQFSRAMESFGGVKRRMDRLTLPTAMPLYEGFGSSADKARAAIAAMRLHYPTNRLVVLFEPHTFSWRNRAMLHWYDETFNGADELFAYHPPESGAATHDQTTLDEIVDYIATKTPLKPHTLGETAQENLATLQTFLQPNDVVLILTSGNLGGLIEPLKNYLNTQA